MGTEKKKTRVPIDGGSVNFFGHGNSENIEWERVGTELTGQKSVKLLDARVCLKRSAKAPVLKRGESFTEGNEGNKACNTADPSDSDVV